MNSSEIRDVVDRAEHLLWVIARHDVERLSARPADALRRLRELEARAAQLGVDDLYGEVLRETPGMTKIFL